MIPEEKQADQIMVVLQGVLVAIDNALLRGNMTEKTVQQLATASSNLKAIGVCYPLYEEKMTKKPKCIHNHLAPYHDNSILCLDCNKVIWQDLNSVDYPNELKTRFTTRDRGE